jgi:hypothetical protein
VKTPIYEVSSGAALALIFNSSRQFAAFDLYSFTLTTGQVLRYTSCDQDIAYGGTNWSSKGVRIDTDQAKALAHWKVGLDVDTWQVVLFPRNRDELSGAAYPDTIGTQPWLAAANAGALDGAVVTVDRAYFPLPVPAATALAPTGVYRIFAGRVAEVDVGRSGTVVNINSHLELLNIEMPRNLYQAPCHYTLFDQRCTLGNASFAVAGTVQPGSTQGSIVTGLGNPPGSGTYALGRVIFTGGANMGFGRAIRSWSGGIIGLLAPFYFPIAAGDPFTIYPGCNKLLATCQSFAYPKPSLSSITGGAIKSTLYYVQITVNANTADGGGTLESAASLEGTLSVPDNQLLVVMSPPAGPNIASWNVYVAKTSGTETLQASGIAIGTNWTEPSTGLIAGVTPPIPASAGNSNNYPGAPYIPAPETAT